MSKPKVNTGQTILIILAVVSFFSHLLYKINNNHSKEVDIANLPEQVLPKSTEQIRQDSINEAIKQLRIDSTNLAQVQIQSRELISIVSSPPVEDLTEITEYPYKIGYELDKIKRYKGKPEIDKEIAALEKKLDKLYPAMYSTLRKNYINSQRRNLWENDIDVNGSGTTITFTAGMFAANKNISSFHDMVGPALRLLKFKQVRYKWYKGDDEYTYYDL